MASSTQNQALNAIVFVYRYVLGKQLGDNELNAVRALQKQRLPVVLSVNEIQDVLGNLAERQRFMGRLIYGCGLRLRECICLRIKDIDFDRKMLIVRSGKGDKDRRNDIDSVYLPGALDRKYANAGKEWGWFWLFPARVLSIDPRALVVRRHHQHPASFQRAFKSAVQKAGIVKQASVHTLRHSFATHLLENGYDIRTIQELLGHQKLQTTMIYTRVACKNVQGIKSPLDE